MRVLVTGASGFLGSHIAEQLSKEGHTVRALVRKSSNRRFLETLPGVEFAEGSVEDAAKVDLAAKGVDAIVHSAGLVKARNKDEFHATNVVGTTNLLAAGKAQGKKLKRFVFVSSLAAVGPSPDGRPVDGEREPNPVTHYGRSKLEAERAVRAAKGELPVTVIRPPLIYGPRDNESFAFFQSIPAACSPCSATARTLCRSSTPPTRPRPASAPSSPTCPAGRLTSSTTARCTSGARPWPTWSAHSASARSSASGCRSACCRPRRSSRKPTASCAIRRSC